MTPQVETSPRPGPPSLLRRLAGGRASRALVVGALSSAGNLLLSLTVARHETVTGVGWFALAFSAYVLASGLARAVVTDSVLASPTAVAQAREGAARALTIGVLSALPVLAAGLAVDSPYLLIAGVAVPGLVLYDFVKAVNLGAGQPRLACGLELLWAVATVLGALLGLVRVVGPVAVFAVWAGAGALIGGLAAVRQRYRVRPGWAAAPGETRVAVSFGAQFLVTTGSAHLALTATAAGAGAAVVGALSAGRTVLGPVNLLLSTAGALMIPYLVRYRDRPGAVRIRSAARVAALVLGCTAPVAVAVALLPDTIGRHLLAANWDLAQPLLLALALESLLTVAATVGFAGHRVERAGRRALLLGTLLGLIRVPAVLGGALLFGAAGAAGAMVAMALASAVVWWCSYLVLLRRPAPMRPVPQPA
ncbi:hypothetical protein [Micromonospora musae]|uniref:hypothetical protein n=1 Tax=Micromonospora musae TaxID=1894970 RepID=UPI00340EEC31